MKMEIPSTTPKEQRADIAGLAYRPLAGWLKHRLGTAAKGGTIAGKRLLQIAGNNPREVARLVRLKAVEVVDESPPAVPAAEIAAKAPPKPAPKRRGRPTKAKE